MEHALFLRKMWKKVAILWRHDLLEQIEHISANLEIRRGLGLLLEKGTPILLRKKLQDSPASGFF